MQENYAKVIIDSDSIIALQAITGNSTPVILIYNLVEDIKRLDIVGITLLYCSRSVNTLKDRMAKEMSHACNPKFVINNIPLVIVQKKKISYLYKWNFTRTCSL